MPNEITVFKEFEANLATLEESNAGMKFPDTPDGIAERRAWHRKLRKATNALSKLRKDTGADYLRLKREVDAEAKAIQVRLDVMELPHKTELDRIEAELQAVIDKKAAEAEAKAEYEKDERLAWLDYRERKAQAIIDAAEETERAEKATKDEAERQKQIEADKLTAVEEAKAKVIQASKDALAKAEKEKAAAVEKAKTDAADAALEVQRVAREAENTRIANELAAQNEIARLAGIEAERVADVTHRTNVHLEIKEAIMTYVKNAANADMLIAAISDGRIDKLEIIY